MKRSLSAAHRLRRGYGSAVCWERGRRPLGAMNPFSSWTRSPASTPNCVQGSKDPGARLVDSDDEGSSRRTREEAQWTFFTLAAQDSTSTRTLSSLAHAV